MRDIKHLLVIAAIVVSTVGLFLLPLVIFGQPGARTPADEILADHRAHMAHDPGRESNGDAKADAVLVARHAILWRVILFRGDDVLMTLGFQSDITPADLRRAVRDLIERYRPSDVAVYDYQRKEWWHPDGREMPATWDGRLPAKVEVKLGSAGL